MRYETQIPRTFKSLNKLIYVYQLCYFQGSIKNIGTYNDLVKSEKVFSSLMESKEEKMEKVCQLFLYALCFYRKNTYFI